MFPYQFKLFQSFPCLLNSLLLSELLTLGHSQFICAKVSLSIVVSLDRSRGIGSIKIKASCGLELLDTLPLASSLRSWRYFATSEHVMGCSQVDTNPTTAGLVLGFINTA